jgi:2'-5' RNA ligase
MADLQNSLQIVSEIKEVNPATISDRSVVETPRVDERMNPISPLVMFIANNADGMIPWGKALKARDAQLRSFWLEESLLSSAVFSMSARMAVLGYEIVNSDPDKPRQKNTIMAVERMLRNSDRGKGWQVFLVKLLVDLYTQDNGAFIELIRKENRPDSPVINIAHLDSYSCYRTGDPLIPVIYRDRFGNDHKMPWWSIQTVEEMPSPVETMYGAQMCAVTRCLMAAQIIRDVAIYKKEKISGQFAKALHFISGIAKGNVEDGIQLANENAMNQNLTHYIQPPIISTIDPDASLTHVQIDLASLPDGFNEDLTLQWYVTQLAVAFGVDYQEFAPLTSGSMGSGQQSETLHLKSRGKGPALLISMLEHILNDTGVLPSNIKFQFLVTDAQADEARANARFLRGKDRALRVSSGELDIEAARELAKEDSDIPVWLLESMKNRPIPTPVNQQLNGGGGSAPAPKQRTAIGNENVEGGLNSRATRKSYESDLVRSEIIKRLLERGDMKEIDPSGFVYLCLENDPQITSILRDYQQLMDDPNIEWQSVPTFHITLAYAPEVTYAQLLEVSQSIHMPQPIPVDLDHIHMFEAGNDSFARALVMLVKKNEYLIQLQKQVVDIFNGMGILLSPYSNPDVWTPHITIGYIPSSADVPEVLPPMYHRIIADKTVVGKGDYEKFATIQAPKMGGVY